MSGLGELASVLAVIGAAQGAGKQSIKLLRRLKHASAEFDQLCEEMDQIHIVLDSIKAIATGITVVPVGLSDLIERAKQNMLAVDILVQYELSKPNNEVDKSAWVLSCTKAQDLMRKLYDIRSNITTLLTAVTL